MSLARVVLNDIGTLANGASARQALNDNFQKIEDEFKKVVYRDGSTPNSMEADLDMNSKRILNVADGTADLDAVNKRQMDRTIQKEVLDQVLTAVSNPNTELFLQDGTGAVPRTLGNKNRERMSPEDFGAVTGSVDGAQRLLNVVAINASLARAATSGKAVSLSGEVYEVDTSITPIIFPSRVALFGNWSTIKAYNDDAPILVSKGWLDDSAPAGRPRIYDLTIQGTSTGTNQHGVIIRDYYPRLSSVRVENVGGRGFWFTHTSKGGVAVAGTLVEPRLIDCEVHQSGRACFYLGEANNNRITDGYLVGSIIARLAPGATEEAVYIGSGAGWKIDAIHTYGGSPSTAISILNAFNTHIGSLYIEDGWTSYAFNLGNYQKNTCVDSIIVEASSSVNGATAAAVRVGRSSSVAYAMVNIGSLVISSDSGASFAAIRNENPTSLEVAVANLLRVTGDGTVTIPNASTTWFYGPVPGIKDTPARKHLTYQTYGVPLSKTVAANATGTKTCTFDIPYIGLSTQAVVDVTISARSYNNGTERATYVGKAVINSKADTDSWVVRLIDVVAPTGFSSNPTASISNNPLSSSDRSGTLTITFAYNDSDAYGACHFLLHQPGS